jgi:hypothetical protein
MVLEDVIMFQLFVMLQIGVILLLVLELLVSQKQCVILILLDVVQQTLQLLSINQQSDQQLLLLPVLILQVALVAELKEFVIQQLENVFVSQVTLESFVNFPQVLMNATLILSVMIQIFVLETAVLILPVNTYL